MKTLLAIISGLFLFVLGIFSQPIISINFVGGGVVGGNPSGLEPAETAGVVPAANWNNVAQNLATGSSDNLVDNLGLTTSAGVAWSSANTWSTVILQTTPDFKMMKGYLDNPSQDITVSVSGVPYTNYEAYVYFNDDNTSGGTLGSYNIGAAKIFGRDAGALFNGTFVRAKGTNAGDSNAVGNYVKFEGLSGGAFTLIAHAEDSFHSSPVNGLQIVSTSSSPQPIVFGWGYNSSGQISPPSGLTNVVAIAAGSYHSLALKSDGLVTAWGNNFDGETNVPPGLSNVAAIAAGYYHSLALKSNGTLVAWGYNCCHQTNVPAAQSNFVAISAGGNDSLALTRAGTVVAWGDNRYGQTNVPSGLSGIRAVAAGGEHVLALRSNGTVVAWGTNNYGQTNVPLGLSGVAAIAAGLYHSLALKSNGTVTAWGYSGNGETNVPVGLSNVVAIAAGDEFSVALKSSGTIVAWGYNYYGQTNVPPGLFGVVRIAAGGYHNLSLTYNPPLALVCPDTVTVRSFDAVPPPAPESIVVPSACGATLKSWLGDSYYTNECETYIARTYQVADSCNRTDSCVQAIIVAIPAANSQCSGAIATLEGFSYSANTICSTGGVATSCSDGEVDGLWYKFTPSVNGIVTVSTSGSIGAVVAAFTGGCGSLSEVGCSSGSTSFPAAGGTNYWIFVGDYLGGIGTVMVTVCPAPPNDQCNGAVEMVEGTIYNANTMCATSTGDPSTSCGDLRGVWFKYTPSENGKATINAFGDGNPIVSVFNSCGSSAPASCAYGSTSFTATANTTYWILVGGPSGVAVNASVILNFCQFLAIVSTNTDSSVQPGGVLVSYHAVVTGTPTITYSWQFFDSFGNPLFSLFSNSDTVSQFFGPFDTIPTSFQLNVSHTCANDQAGTVGSLPPPCPVCLSIGTPSSLNGTSGGGAGPLKTNDCGVFASNALWFKIGLSNNVPGTAVISTEGSDPGYDTSIAVYSGTSQFDLKPLVCNNDIGATNKQSRLQFQAQTNLGYWLVVNGTNGKTLRVTTYYFDPARTLVGWNFNSTNSPAFFTNPPPSTGSGKIAPVGGAASTFVNVLNGDGSSDTNSPNSAWSTSNYPPQGTTNKSRGAQFNASTLDYQYISLGWDQRVSANASKYFRLQSSTDGTNFADFPVPITMSADSIFEAKYLDLSLLPGVNNNSNFVVRILSEWESTAAGTANANYATPSGSGYGTNGTVAFDMFTVYGTPIPKLTNSALSGGQFSFAVSGANGSRFVIQSSSNLLNWLPVATNTVRPTNTVPYNYIGTNARSFPKSFYRAVSQP